MYFKFIKYLWSEGFKKKILGLLTISFGTVLADYELKVNLKI